MLKVTELECAVAGNLPCIIWNQRKLAVSAHWVGTTGSTPDCERSAIKGSVPNDASSAVVEWLRS